MEAKVKALMKFPGGLWQEVTGNFAGVRIAKRKCMLESRRTSRIGMSFRLVDEAGEIVEECIDMVGERFDWVAGEATPALNATQLAGAPVRQLSNSTPRRNGEASFKDSQLWMSRQRTKAVKRLSDAVLVHLQDLKNLCAHEGVKGTMVEVTLNNLIGILDAEYDAAVEVGTDIKATPLQKARRVSTLLSRVREAQRKAAKNQGGQPD